MKNIKHLDADFFKKGNDAMNPGSNLGCLVALRLGALHLGIRTIHLYPVLAFYYSFSSLQAFCFHQPLLYSVWFLFVASWSSRT